MKQVIAIIFLSSFLFSCSFTDDRTDVGIEYVKKRLPEKYIDGSVLSVEKTNGIEYKNKYDGTDMYAMDFIANCRINSEGYLLVDKDDLIRNTHVFSSDQWFEMNERQRELFNYKGSLNVHPGTEIKVASKVIMVKHDNGWEPIDVRGDLY